MSWRRKGGEEMMVGKRGRPCKNPMRRTTSMTEFAPPDVMAAVVEEEEEAMVVGQPGGCGDGRQDWLAAYGGGAAGQDWLAAYRAQAGLRRNSADCPPAETAAFLRACGLCRRRLGPGRDTFMYKGETAFCSLECRQQHMTQEEWKDKCAVTSMKEEEAAAVPKAGHRGPGKPGTDDTVAAA